MIVVIFFVETFGEMNSYKRLETLNIVRIEKDSGTDSSILILPPHWWNLKFPSPSMRVGAPFQNTLHVFQCLPMNLSPCCDGTYVMVNVPRQMIFQEIYTLYELNCKNKCRVEEHLSPRN